MDQFTRVRARFRPTRLETLRATAQDTIGWEGVWEAVWIIEDGPYAGQWAMQPQASQGHPVPRFAWAPLCDLQIIAAVPERSCGDPSAPPAHGHERGG